MIYYASAKQDRFAECFVWVFGNEQKSHWLEFIGEFLNNGQLACVQ